MSPTTRTTYEEQILTQAHTDIHPRGQHGRRARARGRHVPVRTCVGCRSARPATSMVRCTIDESDRPRVGPGSGRGAWVCGPDCVDEAIRRRAFARAWRRNVDRTQLGELPDLVARTMQERADPGTLSGGLTDRRVDAARTNDDEERLTKG